MITRAKDEVDWQFPFGLDCSPYSAEKFLSLHVLVLFAAVRDVTRHNDKNN